MSAPGEVLHEKGRDRSQLFAACLQQIINGFRAEFFVNANPEKLRVEVPQNRGFSFDILGRLDYADTNCEVWIEAKGYDTASKLLSHYRTFVSNVAIAKLYHPRMRSDLFWFVASTPFACEQGARLSSPEFIGETLSASAAAEGGAIHSDEMPSLAEFGYHALSEHIRVLLLTPQLMKTTGLRQYVRSGENLWSLTKKLYGGSLPFPTYQPYVASVADRNNLKNPDLLQIGQKLELPFLGWPDDGLGGV